MSKCLRFPVGEQNGKVQQVFLQMIERREQLGKQKKKKKDKSSEPRRDNQNLTSTGSNKAEGDGARLALCNTSHPRSRGSETQGRTLLKLLLKINSCIGRTFLTVLRDGEMTSDGEGCVGVVVRVLFFFFYLVCLDRLAEVQI